jgi:hypothetical protein
MTYTQAVEAELDGYFRLDDARQVRRTLHARLTVPSTETKQHALTTWIATVEVEGYEFAEGHGQLTQLLSQRILR